MTIDTDQLSEQERRHLLRAFDDLVATIPGRRVREVELELAEVRRARRPGGRRSSSERRR